MMKQTTELSLIDAVRRSLTFLLRIELSSTIIYRLCSRTKHPLTYSFTLNLATLFLFPIGEEMKAGYTKRMEWECHIVASARPFNRCQRHR